MNKPNYIINAVSTKIREDNILLDISVKGKIDKILEEKEFDIKNLFEPLRELKNRVFFDSITARALLKYIPQNKVTI